MSHFVFFVYYMGSQFEIKNDFLFFDSNKSAIRKINLGKKTEARKDVKGSYC
jgi:hypothetical protein